MGKRIASPIDLPEKLIENQILNYLSWKKIYAWKVKTTANYSPKFKSYIKTSALYRKGIADIIGILPGGVLLAIEVKTRTGRLAPHQKVFLDEITSRGGVSIVARSLEDVETWFKGYIGGQGEADSSDEGTSRTS